VFDKRSIIVSMIAEALQGEILDIITYPLTGAAAFHHKEITTGPSGLIGDREWLLLGSDGRRVSQKSFPDLRLVMASKQPWGLNLYIPGEQHLDIDNDDFLDQVSSVDEFGTPTPIHRSRYIHEGLSSFLSTEITVARKTKEWLDGQVIPVWDRKNRPLHIIGSASIEEECRIREVDVLDRLNWRENLIVKTTVPFEENSWVDKSMLIKSHKGARKGALHILKRTVRCPVPGNELQPEELIKNLPSSYPELRRMQGDLGSATHFGVYAYSTGPIGVGHIRLGDIISLDQA
jgi:uncharacterized protein YcbX